VASAGLQNTLTSDQPWPRSALLLLQIRLSCAVAAIAGAALFCWAWSGFTIRNFAANYRWNEVIFTVIVLIVLRRRAFPLAVGTAIFAGIWIVAAFLWMDKFLP
jgi:hypothetical protein